MRVSFLIAAFNEAGTIGEALERINALGLDRQIVVVDDTPLQLDFSERNYDANDREGEGWRLTHWADRQVAVVELDDGPQYARRAEVSRKEWEATRKAAEKAERAESERLAKWQRKNRQLVTAQGSRPGVAFPSPAPAYDLLVANEARVGTDSRRAPLFVARTS
jgi:hypothetical protein